MLSCEKCLRPATGRGLCPYHGGFTVKQIVRRRDITRSAFRKIGGYSDRTIDRIYSGERKLSELELRGLLSIKPGEV